MDKDASQLRKSSLRAQFNPRWNSIGFIRLAASIAVIIGHAFPYGGFGEDPLITLTNNQAAIGRVPVDIFFCLSGFLITRSWEKAPSIWVYLWHRFLRIYPALWACVLLTGAVLAPAMGAQSDYLYVVRNSILVLGIDFTIEGLFDGNPHTNLVNGALWTLPYEVYAYTLIACCGIASKRIRKYLIVALLLLNWGLFAALIIDNPGLATSGAITSPYRLFTFFFVGSAFYHFQDLIVVSAKIAAACVMLLVGALILGCHIMPHSGGLFYIIAPVPLTYLVFWMSIRLPFQRVNTKTDLSYGVYIYGTLVLSLLSKQKLNSDPLTYISMAIAISVAIAYCSWRLIEAPALGLKTYNIFKSNKGSDETRIE